MVPPAKRRDSLLSFGISLFVLAQCLRFKSALPRPPTIVPPEIQGVIRILFYPDCGVDCFLLTYATGYITSSLTTFLLPFALLIILLQQYFCCARAICFCSGPPTERSGACVSLLYSCFPLSSRYD